ncbi:YicC family protein [Gammaproteobacteria bacterium]|nr:YicC family protein [Gammaproteobacteria bacterium]
MSHRIVSMTGFGRRQLETEQGRIECEMRSVNQRYLDIAPRLADGLRGFEPMLRQAIGERLKRGRVDVTMRFFPASPSLDGALDIGKVSELIALCDAVKSIEPGLATMSASEVLAWPGVVIGAELDEEKLHADCTSLLNEVLDELIAFRQREGQRIGELLQERIDGIRQQASIARERLPAVSEGYANRLRDRLAELKDLDSQRLEQEILLFSQRVDVAEELDRLDGHCREFERALGKDNAVGRRLDFLLQEINREANTLGSKSADQITSASAIELKVLIEQAREQVQNVE